MIFEENKTPELLGRITGYTFAYFLFTTILFFILHLSHKLPASWSYFHILTLVFLIALTGIMMKRALK